MFVKLLYDICCISALVKTPSVVCYDVRTGVSHCDRANKFECRLRLINPYLSDYDN